MSKYGSVDAPAQSSSCFATAMYLLNGTPIIFQGEEIGMTGFPFECEQDFVDVNAKTLFSLAKTDEEKKQILKKLIKESRDNARTCMQWDDSINAGFSKSTTWFKVNPNYTYINVASELKDKHSTICEYKKLLALRKKYLSTFVYGDCKFLSGPQGVIRYLRKGDNQEFEIIANLTPTPKKLVLPKDKIVYSNQAKFSPNTLAPFQAIVFKR